MKYRVYSNPGSSRLGEIARQYNTALNISYLSDFLFVFSELSKKQSEELSEILSKNCPATGFGFFQGDQSVAFSLPAEGYHIHDQVNDPSLKLFVDKYNRINNASNEIWEFNGKRLDFNQAPFIMGILNATPDSFSDGGKYSETQKAVNRALEMVDQGANIVDVGGESTRPGSLPVDVNRELERVIPVIEGIRRQSDVIISIDSYKSHVAEAALDAGANIINDISGGTFDKRMMPLAGQCDVPFIIMHIFGAPRNMQKNPEYDIVTNDIYDYFKERIQVAEQHGIRKTILDPGIGFGKRLEDNLKLIRNLRDFLWLEKPLLIGTSRKSFIGNLLDKMESERLTGTLITNYQAIQNGVKILRVHDVEEIADMIKLVNAINS